MKVYNAIGLQITIIGLAFTFLAIIGRYYPSFFDITIAVIVIGLLLSPSPFREWRDKEIREGR